MPMILWSSEKMYLRMKLRSGCSWPVAPWVWPTLMTILVRGDREISSLPRTRSRKRRQLAESLPLRVAARAPLHLDRIRQPAIVTRLVLVDVEASLHLVVAPAAQLGAGQFP